MASTTYTVQDRTLPDTWAFIVSDRRMGLQASGAPVLVEPILLDRVDGTHYRLFIDNRRIALESTAAPVTSLFLIDSVTGTSYEWIVENRILGIVEGIEPPIRLLLLVGVGL